MSKVPWTSSPLSAVFRAPIDSIGVWRERGTLSRAVIISHMRSFVLLFASALLAQNGPIQLRVDASGAPAAYSSRSLNHAGPTGSTNVGLPQMDSWRAYGHWAHRQLSRSQDHRGRTARGLAAGQRQHVRISYDSSSGRQCSRSGLRLSAALTGTEFLFRQFDHQRAGRPELESINSLSAGIRSG